MAGVVGGLLAVGALGISACGGTDAGDTDTNTYWYCWDTGAKAPHHLGHYVSGDHVCSDDELQGTGFKAR